ncbi:hypothetical protein DPMN_027889 [Dreissena polymorpha]|uniref:Uncharacterized protein n=1 Tax=Dreissena polymorpha TaxID=45954 RepID=A0A9D4LW67_DREPO|nr:hypothetical protein DPMN_027889 [Dreissena polymorpha]
MLYFGPVAYISIIQEQGHFVADTYWVINEPHESPEELSWGGSTKIGSPSYTSKCV